MKVWRVEDANGIGLHSKMVGEYNELDLISPTAFNLAIYSDWCAFDDDLRVHIPPEEDKLLQKNLKKNNTNITDYLFGFDSPQKMRNYLYKDSWIKLLEQYGMQVALYWVDSGTILGKHQTLIPKNVKPVEKTPIGEYFGIK